MVRLVTIRFSHYCDKARWALEHAGIPFQEDAHLPLFAWGPALRAAGKRTVPALVTDGKRLADSTEILRWADAGRGQLYPTAHEAEVAALEDEFDLKLGPASRRLAYYNVLKFPLLVDELFARSGPRWEIAIGRVAQPLISKMLKRGLKIDDQGAARSQAVIDRVFAQVAERLADGRRFLVGDQFTAADLTFAALAGPVLFPPYYETYVLPWDRVTPSLREEYRRYRETPAGRFAMRLYAERRSAPVS